MSVDHAGLPDLTDETFLSGDRTQEYLELRAMGAAVPLPTADGVPTWLVSHHADVAALNRLPETRLQPAGAVAPEWLDEGPALQRLKANLSQIDAPAHTRLRKVVGPMFIPRRVEQFRELATDSVRRAIERLLARTDVVDAVQDLAVDVPKGVICSFLGIPEEDWGVLTKDQHNFLLIFSPMPIDGAQKSALDQITQFYLDYFDEFVRSRSLEQHSPFVRLVLEAERAGEISHVEALSLLHTVLDAGYETTRTSISNAVQLLGQHPHILGALREEPGLVNNIVEEFLRYRTPVHVRVRFLTDNYVASDGTVLAAGSKVILMLAAANRDGAVFGNGDELDILRENAGSHQAFGGGLHHCLGAPIARIQLQETLLGLADAFSHIELCDGSHRYPDLMFPALMTLPVRFHTA